MVSNKMHSIEELKGWQKSIEPANDSDLLVSELQSTTKRGSLSQTKPRAFSFPSDIAMRIDRDSLKEFRYSLTIANGSANGLDTRLSRLAKVSLSNYNKIHTTSN